MLCGSLWGGGGSGIWLSKKEARSSGRASRLLDGDLRRWRRADVDDVEGFSKREIVVDGCESRGGQNRPRSELSGGRQKSSIGERAALKLREGIWSARRRQVWFRHEGWNDATNGGSETDSGDDM
ncbi:hypothetical protein IMZ48_05490 [Candidatus Bathyarchaeota archaeon]|nr:hypothetical protein [Candidatus Bathyarchaeota archaeon]